MNVGGNLTFALRVQLSSEETGQNDTLFRNFLGRKGWSYANFGLPIRYEKPQCDEQCNYEAKVHALPMAFPPLVTSLCREQNRHESKARQGKSDARQS
jgi:hypothetical protein